MYVCSQKTPIEITSLMVWSSITYSVQLVSRMSRSSCVTMITPPLYSLMASAKASIDSISRLLVGSSRINTSGPLRHSSASATRAFCPPDKSFILIIVRMADQPKRAERFARLFVRQIKQALQVLGRRLFGG